MRVYLLLTASRKMHHTDRSESLIARRSRKSMFSSNIRSFWYCPRKPCSRIRSKRWTPTRTTRLPSDRERSAMQTSSSLVFVWASNWLPQSRHRLCRRQSRSSSQRRIWRTSLGSLALPRCSRPDRTSSSRTRSSTFPQNPLRYTFYGPSYASDVLRASKLSVLRRWRRSHCWIRPTPLSTSSYERKTSSRFTSNVWRASSSSATLITLSSLIGTGGEPGQTGELHGKVHRKHLPSSILTSSLSSLASSRYDIWRAGLWYTSSQRRILGGCTRQLERYVNRALRAGGSGY
jgi:hypothetical protein